MESQESAIICKSKVGNSAQLSNNNLTAHFKRESNSRPEYVNVMSNVPLSSGKTTWRIQVERRSRRLRKFL